MEGAKRDNLPTSHDIYIFKKMFLKKLRRERRLMESYCLFGEIHNVCHTLHQT